MQELLNEVRRHYALSNGEARRLFHGRGQCFDGFNHVVIDWFRPVIVMRIYDIVDPGVEAALSAEFQSWPQVEGIVLQRRVPGEKAESQCIWGAVADHLVAYESGLKFHVNPMAPQNSGLFLDMRHGRQWVRENVENKRVLNLFSYTCGFSVYALAGGADSVVNLDMSKGALSIGRKNHALNEMNQASVQFLTHDLFKSWGKLKRLGPFDLVIIDPPSFQKGSFVAELDYKKVIRRLVDLLSMNGQVLACHNDPSKDTSFLKREMAEHCPQLTFVQRISNPEDFPEAFPERGLKTLLFRREV